MSAAAFESDGTVKPLDLAGDVPIVVTPSDVQDPARLARMIQDVRRELAALKREWRPSVRYFRDQIVDATGATKYQFRHGFGGRVNWYVVAWDASGGTAYHALEQHSDTDSDTLVLISSSAGTLTLRVEEAGA